MEDPAPDRAGPTDRAEPPLTAEALATQARAEEVACAGAAPTDRVEGDDPVGEPEGFSLSKPVLGESR
jgi:hypothetical protein